MQIIVLFHWNPLYDINNNLTRKYFRSRVCIFYFYYINSCFELLEKYCKMPTRRTNHLLLLLVNRVDSNSINVIFRLKSNRSEPHRELSDITFRVKRRIYWIYFLSFLFFLCAGNTFSCWNCTNDLDTRYVPAENCIQSVLLYLTFFSYFPVDSISGKKNSLSPKKKKNLYIKYVIFQNLLNSSIMFWQCLSYSS